MLNSCVLSFSAVLWPSLTCLVSLQACFFRWQVLYTVFSVCWMNNDDDLVIIGFWFDLFS